MATYKLIQDIEAEDKILGPLTLRQFIFALATAFFLYLCFIVVSKGASYLLMVFLPPALLTGFFAFPFGKDQPTEVWVVAKLGFWFRPRKRIWDQSGVKELVTVTVPKKLEHVYTNGLSQNEVRSRLSALASTIDSRGWAIKNVNVNMYAQSGLTNFGDSDRLVSMSSLPQAVVDYDIKPSDDILDEHSNPIAQQFTQMITASSNAHRQQIIDTLNGVSPVIVTPQTTQVVSNGVPNDMWFADAQTATPIAATPTDAEVELLEHIKADRSAYHIGNSHIRMIHPLSRPATPVAPMLNPVPVPSSQPVQQAQPVQPVEPPAVAMPAQPDPAMQNLARSNDLSISTLAREAHRVKLNEDTEQGEVIISLR